MFFETNKLYTVSSLRTQFIPFGRVQSLYLDRSDVCLIIRPQQKGDQDPFVLVLSKHGLGTVNYFALKEL